MRKLFLCIALTAVCGIVSTTSSHAPLAAACAFVCCNRPSLPSTTCSVGSVWMTCGTFQQTHGCF